MRDLALKRQAESISTEQPVTRIIVAVFICFLGGCASTQDISAGGHQRTGDAPMKLGNFSVSLTVKDLAASRAFYEKLGFRAMPGIAAKNMAIMQNDTCTIGLFQGMFDKNTLTFNPGWDSACAMLPEFEDVREIQKALKSKGIVPAVAADESTTGPAFMMVIDPDGNPVLFDQHVPSPRK
jgi:catechol 2,3-dioxygenase-like lactoylglutathione lyase family enzyme